MNLILCGLTLLALSLNLAACSFSSGEGITELSGPILSLNIGSSLDEQGGLTDPSFTFSSTQPQITVVANIGVANGQTLQLIWYRLSTEGKPEELFRHDIEVASRDAAFSVGQNPGVFLPGWYRVTATMEDQSQDVEFVIEEDEAVAEVDMNASPASSGPPSAGASGTNQSAAQAVSSAANPIQSAPQIEGWLPNASVLLGDQRALEVDMATRPDLKANLVEIWLAFGWIAPDEIPDQLITLPSFTAEYTAYVNGVEIGIKKFTHDATINALMEERSFKIDPCKAGIDRPGTSVRVVGAVIVEGKKYVTSDVTIKLGDDTMEPGVVVVAKVNGVELTQREFHSGYHVDPGDKIVLEVTATEIEAGGPWQTGVQFIQVFANGESINGEGEGDYSDWRGRTCQQKSREQTYIVTYIVPKDQPKIEICATATDFADNINGRKDNCGTFYTGQVWRGTMRSEWNLDLQDYTGQRYTCKAEYNTELDLVVDSDSAITGEANMRVVSYECSFPPLPLSGAGHVETATLTIQGTAYPDHLELYFAPTLVASPEGTWSDGNANLGLNLMMNPSVEQSIPITAAGVARGVVSADLGGGTYTLINTFDLRCEICEPEPVSQR